MGARSGSGVESSPTIIDLTLSDDEIDAAPFPVSTRPKQDGRLSDFSMYARSLGPPKPQERQAEMEEEDAPKFVTPLKGTKNKKPTTFDSSNDGCDSSSLYSSDADDGDAHLILTDTEDDNEDLFPSDVDDEGADLLHSSGVEAGLLVGRYICLI